MDVEMQSLLVNVLKEPSLAMAIRDREIINGLVETAMVDEDAMKDLLDTIDSSSCRAIATNGFKRRWTWFKAVRWGIQSLTQLQIARCITDASELTRLREVLQRSFEKGSAGRCWWSLRLNAANQFLDRTGLAESHESAVKDYAARMSRR